MTDIVERLRTECTDSLTELLLREAADEIEKLRRIRDAAQNLLTVKGRHHTEQAYKMLEEVMKESEK